MKKIRDGESQPREDAGARKGRKVAKHCVFPMICGSGGSKSRLAKAAGAEPARQMKDDKLHAVEARSTFGSQHGQNTVKMLKSARRCGGKQNWKSKWTKHHMFGALLEVKMSKKCTPLWREARLEVNMFKTPHVRAIYGRPDVVWIWKKCAPWWREAYAQAKSAKNCRF